MFSDDMPKDWKPSPPPDVGSLRWKRDIVEHSLMGKLPKQCSTFDAGGIGIFCVDYSTRGWSYFWVNKEDARVLPGIDWNALIKDALTPADLKALEAMDKP